jgi:hypothetical protein
MYGCDPHTNKPRTEWPILWVQNNPLFCGYIGTVILNGNHHCVAVREDGVILDPWREGEFKFADYENVYSLMAIFDVRSDA